MSRHVPKLVGLLGLLLLVQGCEAPLPEIPPPVEAPSVDDAFGAWETIAKAPPASRDVEKAIMLTSVLASQAGGLTPMVALLGDETVPGEQKVFAIVCLTSQREALGSHEETLVSWTGSTYPSDTRKLATHVLGLLDSPSALAVMGELLEDPDRAVREAAMGVLLSFHPETVSERLLEFWNDPETSAAIRNQVVLGMPPHLVSQFLPVYAAAVVDGRLSEPARLRAVSVLGQLGNHEHIAVLEACIAEAPEEAVREHARGALALLRVSAETEPSTATE